MGEFDPTRILAALQHSEVRYVLIGGMAATVHGSPHVTFDVDVTPATDEENLEALSRALDDLGALIRTDAAPEGLPFDHSGESLGRATVWNLTTEHGDLDVTMMPAGTRGYDDLAREAREIDVLGVRVTVASLADVVRSKQAAGREKDHVTLPTLRRLLELGRDRS